MKKIISLFALSLSIFALTSCTMPNTPSVPVGYSVKTVKRGNVKMEYRDWQTIVNKERERGKALMKTEAEIQRSLKYRSKGGYISLTVYAATIGAANTKYWHILLIDSDGKLIRRSGGHSSIANVPGGAEWGWWNTTGTGLSEPIADSLRVRVLQFDKVEAEYIITRNQ